MGAARGIAGGAVGSMLVETGAMARLGGAALRVLLGAPFGRGRVRWRTTVEQALDAGNRSLPLVGALCFLVGIIVGLQSAYQLARFGATALIADLVAVSITRELGPLLAAIIVAGRFGSAVAAEIGTMRVTQEIDALEVMGIDPVHYLVVPRMAALLVTLPCLTVFANTLGITGGFIVGSTVLDITPASYLARTLDALRLGDVYTGLIKSAVFAIVIGLEACWQGLNARGGPDRVGHATTQTVVRSIVLIVAVDLFFTALFFVRGS